MTYACQCVVAGYPSSSMTTNTTTNSKTTTTTKVTTTTKSTMTTKNTTTSDTTTTTTRTTTTTQKTSTTWALNSATTGAYVKNKGKRGLAYNDVTLTQPFSRAGQNSQVSWAYNWYLAENGNSFNSALMYVPILWNNATDLTSLWPTAAETSITNGATSLMSFNEPDWCASGSACMEIPTAVAAWKKYMQPFAGKAKLVAPSVTNAGAPYGLTWLENFIGNCTACTIDAINLHVRTECIHPPKETPFK